MRLRLHPFAFSLTKRWQTLTKNKEQIDGRGSPTAIFAVSLLHAVKMKRGNSHRVAPFALILLFPLRSLARGLGPKNLAEVSSTPPLVQYDFNTDALSLPNSAQISCKLFPPAANLFFSSLSSCSLNPFVPQSPSPGPKGTKSPRLTRYPPHTRLYFALFHTADL